MAMTDPPPDWNDLRDVLLMAEAKSLSEAARRAGVSQSTMSRRLVAIEQGGLAVFSRDAAGALVPTARGEVLIAAARQMRAAWQDAAQRLGAVPQPLRIAACEVTGRFFMSEALPDWSARAEVPAELAIHDDLFALDRGAYDLIVTPADSLPEGAVGVEIGRLDWGIYAAPAYLAAHPLRAGSNSLDGHRVIRASGSLARIRGYAAFAALGGAPALLSSSPFAQAEACARGQGIAALPRALGQADARLVALDLAVPEATAVWLIADRHSAGHPRIAAFLRWARRRFATKPVAAAGA